MTKVLVIAPHADDEILGCGGTIARFVREGKEVYVAILTAANASSFLFDAVVTPKVKKDALATHQFLGVKETIFCEFPPAQMDMLPHAEVNAKILEVIKKIQPEIVFIPFVSDIHLDHQCAFLSALVAMRPNERGYPSKIYAYETLSETNWNAPYLTAGFHPNLFIDISKELPLKLQVFAMHETQVKAFPHERSLKALEALAVLRGSTVHREAAEAFVIIREVMSES